MNRKLFATLTVVSAIALFSGVAAAQTQEAGLVAIAACAEGAKTCSDDGYVLSVCVKGEIQKTDCMNDKGMLCERGACIEPWKYGSPVWPRAQDEQAATKETLAEKARYYDDIAARLHVHPELKWIMTVDLKCAARPCKPDEKEPCRDCTTPVAPQESATWKDVERWHSGENDGLFSALYMAAQAFRYAVTKDPQALSMLKVLMEGEETRLKITGVPGLFTRQFIQPGIPGLSCPADIESYMPDKEKDDNMWVRIGEDGCVWTVDPKTREWNASKHCGLDEYKNWCFLDNVSKDEYSGHMFALGIVAKLVDDPQINQSAKWMLSQVADNMIQNKLEFIDWDKRVTEHGRLFAMALDDFPGFNGAMALDYIKMAAVVTGDKKYHDFYDNCLLQKAGRKNCLRKLNEIPKPYTTYMGLAGNYRGKDGCETNFNNIAMHMLSMHNLIWFETDPAIREIYQNSLDVDVFRAKDQPRAVMNQNNAFYDFIFAAQKKLGPNSDGPAYDVVENGIRMMRQFPARKDQRNVSCPTGKCVETCKNRFDAPTGMYARTVSELCLGQFVWWGDPYTFGSCKENKRVVMPPTDYLLAYWMGRYYGFISEDM